MLNETKLGPGIYHCMLNKQTSRYILASAMHTLHVDGSTRYVVVQANKHCYDDPNACMQAHMIS